MTTEDTTPGDRENVSEVESLESAAAFTVSVYPEEADVSVKHLEEGTVKLRINSYRIAGMVILSEREVRQFLEELEAAVRDRGDGTSR